MAFYHLFSKLMLMHSRLWYIFYSVKLLPAVFGPIFGKRRLSCLFISPGQNLTLQIIVELVFYHAYRFAWKNCFLISFILMFDTNFLVDSMALLKSAASLHNCWNMLKIFKNVLMPMKISVLYTLTFKRLLTLCHTNCC